MLNFFFKKQNNDPVKCFCQKKFAPREEFICNCRVLFLAKIEERRVLIISRRPGFFKFFPVIKYSFASLLIIGFLGAGLTIYADTNDVSIDNPFYSFKRTGEKIQLAVYPKSMRLSLHYKFAKRRLGEMKRMINVKLNKDALKILDENYNENIGLALRNANEATYEKAEKVHICENMVETIKFHREIGQSPRPIEVEFSHHCGNPPLEILEI